VSLILEIINKRKAIQKGQSKMDIQEKLVTYGTQYEEKRNKIYASTNNVNKT